MKLLVHDVTEQILERLPPKSLIRFKSVSKQWKSTIESQFFQQKHLTHHRQKPKNPDLLLKTIDDNVVPSTLESIMTLDLKSSVSHNIPIQWENNDLYIICPNSCDGLICLFNEYNSVIIFNPATRWYRTLPPSTYQQKQSSRQLNPLGFGKDQISGLFKPVWLYNNSLELISANATTCEVFDFNINDWRFIEPSSPKRIGNRSNPVYLNGLLYWLTKKDEEGLRSVLSLDLYTETFEIVCKSSPFTNTVLYNVNDNLCGVDEMGQSRVIWWLNLEEKTWKKLYNIDLSKICRDFEGCWCLVSPVGFMGENNKLMLFSYYPCRCVRSRKYRLMIYDHETTSFHEVCTHDFTDSVCYFQSLISIL